MSRILLILAILSVSGGCAPNSFSSNSLFRAPRWNHPVTAWAWEGMSEAYNMEYASRKEMDADVDGRLDNIVENFNQWVGIRPFHLRVPSDVDDNRPEIHYPGDQYVLVDEITGARWLVWVGAQIVFINFHPTESVAE